MRYKSTRSGENVSAGDALLQGLAADGGLYIPESLPAPFIDCEFLKNKTYREVADFVLHRFLTDIPEKELEEMTKAAYTGTFETDDIVPVKRMTEAFSFAEMFHGRTCAFKDLALSLFPHLLLWARKQKKDGKKILILTATSGDTGKAALEGFRDISGINIMVFYPSHGVSPLQQDQMQKQPGRNVRVIGIDGNFDDAQSTLKRIFSSDLREESAENGVLFSSANSINIGRLLPQIVYYVWIWLRLIKNATIGENEAFNVVVPTGNFGNILAAWMAKKIGVPIGRLICASNENKVLSDFFETGIYDINREFHLTEAPSMDILISSNFERFLYYVTGSEEKVASAMECLKREGKYKVSKGELETALGEISGGWASPDAMRQAMSDVYEKYDYLMDPHTAVSYAVYNELRRQGKIERHSHTVIAGTAHPYKFPGVVADILGIQKDGTPYDILRAVEEKTNIRIPVQLGNLEKATKRFIDTIKRDQVEKSVCEYVDEIVNNKA